MPAAGPIGIIANPASGKDIRRLVTRASVFDNQEKQAIVQRAIAGAIAAGARSFLYMDDGYGISRQAAVAWRDEAEFVELESPGTNSALDTMRITDRMREANCSVVISLGGDGTNRAIARSWLDVPLVAISTGTNNVFPRMVEATLAGSAAGLVASGAVSIDEAGRQSKVVLVEVEGERPDLALIDAVLTNERFTGSKALWHPDSLMTAVLARAEPSSVGISSIGGLLQPVTADQDAALWLRFGPGGLMVNAPIAPGFFEAVSVAEMRELQLGEPVTVTGPGVLAFDGERERAIGDGQRATLRVERSGPRVVDIDLTLGLAAGRGAFRITERE